MSWTTCIKKMVLAQSIEQCVNGENQELNISVLLKRIWLWGGYESPLTYDGRSNHLRTIA
jgi:hypothetical protein